MKLAVIGSRTLEPDLEPHIPPGVAMIISGGARGVDTAAEQYAARHGIEIQVLRPDYRRYRKGAPHIRNRRIVDEADEVLAFWDGASPGTRATVAYARAVNKPVTLILCPPPPGSSSPGS